MNRSTLVHILNLVAVAALGALTVAAYRQLLPPSASIFGFRTSGGATALDIASALVLYVLTLFGIWTQTIHSALSAQGPKKIAILPEIAESFKHRSFWAAVLVSPMVFISTYAATGASPDSIASLVLAYQNGFFWKAMIRRS